MMRKFLLLGMLLAIILCLGGCGHSIDISAFLGKQGNTNQNIVQGGFAAREGNYIYFSTNERLYEMDIRNDKILTIPGIKPMFGYLNIINPYVICSAEDLSKPGRPSRLTLYTLDGKYAKVLDKKMHVPILVVDEWVYATTAKDGPLYRWCVDGTKKRLLTDDQVGEFHILGEWIYYKSAFRIKKMRLDGSEKCDILPDEKVGSFYVEPDTGFIYYRNLNDDDKIYRANLEDAFCEKVVDYPCIYFQKKGEEIYFQNIKNELYHVSLAKKEPETAFIADNIVWINIMDDIILVKDNDMNVYMLDKDYQMKMLKIPEPEEDNHS